MELLSRKRRSGELSLVRAEIARSCSVFWFLYWYHGVVAVVVRSESESSSSLRVHC